VKTYRLRLRPLSPFATPWHADSLFGALAWRCAETYGEDVLTGWLDRFLRGDPPFLLSDALPGDWFPAPLGPVYRSPSGGKVKIPVWVKSGEFVRMLRDPEYRNPQSLTGDSEMSTPADRRHASLGRLSGATDESGALFEVEQRILSTRSGEFLSLYLRADSTDHIEPLIDLLAKTGFGRKSSTGLGAFQLDGQAELYSELDAFPEANGFVSLSHFTPALNDPTQGAWRTHVSYPKFHGSSVLHPMKGRLLFLTPGSCFHTRQPPREWYGRAVPIQCEFPAAMQYAFAFAVPARILAV
jgi:CRISPR-associated protein Csm4